MTDQEKFVKLLKEIGVEFEEDGNTIYINHFYCDGADEFGISFWDGRDYPKGKFHEFWTVPEVRYSTIPVRSNKGVADNED